MYQLNVPIIFSDDETQFRLTDTQQNFDVLPSTRTLLNKSFVSNQKISGMKGPRYRWILLPPDTRVCGIRKASMHQHIGGPLNRKSGLRLKKAFETLKIALTSAPALEFPDVAKPSYLSIKQNTKGVTTQILGPWKCPITYLSKQFHPVAMGWLSQELWGLGLV